MDKIMTINAKVAHKIAEYYERKDEEKITEKQLKEINEKINIAARQGRYSIFACRDLSSDAIKELKRNGFKVESCIGTPDIISW